MRAAAVTGFLSHLKKTLRKEASRVAAEHGKDKGWVRGVGGEDCDGAHDEVGSLLSQFLKFKLSPYFLITPHMSLSVSVKGRL